MGSAFSDKLASWDGDDFVYADAGNDELFGGNGDDTLIPMTGKDRSTGGLGLDTFIYEEGDGKDRILDFNVKQDALLIDRDLARSLKTVTKLAEEKGSKVVFNFGGGDKLIVDNLTLAKFGKVAFSFLDIDN